MMKVLLLDQVRPLKMMKFLLTSAHKLHDMYRKFKLRVDGHNAMSFLKRFADSGAVA